MNQVLGITPEVLNLAIAAELDMGEAATYMSKQLKAFNLTADDSGRVVDVLAKAAASANTDVPGMAIAFRQVGPAAAAANLEIEDTAAILARLQDVGLAPQQAGTALRNLFLRFSKIDPPKAAVDAVERLGLSYTDLQDKVLAGDIVGAFEDLSAAGLDLKSAGGLFGPFAAIAGLTLARDTESIRELTTELENAEGTAEQMRITIEGGLPGALARFRSVIESVALTIAGTGLADRFAEITETVSKLIGRFKELPPNVQEIIGWMLLAGPAVLLFGVAISLLGAALGALASPIGLIVLAIAAIGIAAFVFRDKIASAFNAVKSFVGNLVETILEQFPWIGDIVRYVADTIKSAWSSVWSNLKATWESFQPVFDLIRQHWDTIKKVLLVFMAVALAPLVLAFGVLVATLLGLMLILSKLLQLLTFVWKTIAAFVGDLFSGMSLYDAGRKLLQTFLDGILSIKDKIFDGIKNIAGKIRDFLPFSDAKVGPLSDITVSGRALVETLAKGIGDGDSAIPGALRHAFQGLPALAAPLPVGPAPAAAGAGGDTTINIDVGPISITAPPGSDAEAIAGAIDGVLDDRLRRVAEQFASRVRA